MVKFYLRRLTPKPSLLAALLLLLFSTVAAAQIEQFSMAQCAQLEAALELNREQQRRGYKLKQELKIKAQQAQLELQLHYHCQQPQDLQKPARSAGKPAKTTRAKPTARIARPAATPPATTKPALTVSVIAVKAPYQGAKLDAWLAYYQAPFYCYAVRQTERIRQCVEQRQQAQQRFEQQFAERQPSQTNNLSDQ